MSISTLKAFYNFAPRPIRAAFGLLPPPNYFSPHFHHWLSVIRKAEQSPNYLLAHRTSKLRQILTIAIDNSPYYSQFKRDSALIALIDHDPFVALKEFPIISKKEIIDNPSAFINRKATDINSYIATTGGTTGNPLPIRLSNTSWGIEWAFVFSYLSKFGITQFDRRISVRGVRFSESNSATEHNPTYRELRVSPFHIAPSHKEEIVRAILDFKPRYIHGYPTAILSLSKLIDSDRDCFTALKIALCVSENLSSDLATSIEQTLGCTVTSFYGLTERSAFLEFAPGLKHWRPNDVYGITEILGDRIVGTGFINSAMPLIRYDTGDHVKLDSSGNILEILGRWNHAMLNSRSGGQISMTALNLHSEKFAQAGEFQVFQKTPGAAEIHFLGWQNSNAQLAAEHIAAEFTNKCSGQIHFTARSVNDFILTPLGKRPLVVNTCNKNDR